jgi:hypothetical protein
MAGFSETISTEPGRRIDCWLHGKGYPWVQGADSFHIIVGQRVGQLVGVTVAERHQCGPGNTSGALPVDAVLHRASNKRLARRANQTDMLIFKMLESECHRDGECREQGNRAKAPDDFLSLHGWIRELSWTATPNMAWRDESSEVFGWSSVWATKYRLTRPAAD